MFYPYLSRLESFDDYGVFVVATVVVVVVTKSEGVLAKRVGFFSGTMAIARFVFNVGAPKPGECLKPNVIYV